MFAISKKPSDFLTPAMLIRAYCAGIFPMADQATGMIEWYAPDPRAILPLDEFHVPKTLARLVRRGSFEIAFDQHFEMVVRCCANRADTWISEEIIRAYTRLHTLGLAHSVESLQDGKLVGGLYGVSVGGAYFGESMFHHVRDASKVALVHLVDRLRQKGFLLLDTQFATEHLARFGVREIPRSHYLIALKIALDADVGW